MTKLPDAKTLELTERIRALVAIIDGDPQCKRAGCFGRGYIGFSVAHNGELLPNLCDCSRVLTGDANQFLTRFMKVELELGLIRSTISQISGMLGPVTVIDEIHAEIAAIKASLPKPNMIGKMLFTMPPDARLTEMPKNATLTPTKQE